jgi:hypothetical protein
MFGLRVEEEKRKKRDEIKKTNEERAFNAREREAKGVDAKKITEIAQDVYTRLGNKLRNKEALTVREMNAYNSARDIVQTSGKSKRAK